MKVLCVFLLSLFSIFANPIEQRDVSQRQHFPFWVKLRYRNKSGTVSLSFRPKENAQQMMFVVRYRNRSAIPVNLKNDTVVLSNRIQTKVNFDNGSDSIVNDLNVTSNDPLTPSSELSTEFPKCQYCYDGKCEDVKCRNEENQSMTMLIVLLSLFILLLVTGLAIVAYLLRR